ncbi:MAG: hypothetical protein IPL46_23920 [Saprospiraceae bacterium]|nr:hypothetical protein [Saprospiraceae bacterium]
MYPSFSRSQELAREGIPKDPWPNAAESIRKKAAVIAIGITVSKEINVTAAVASPASTNSTAYPAKTALQLIPITIKK